MNARTAERTPAPPLASVFILSAAALAYEVLLVRMFSIIHWHHFAFMVISIALLGYGVSGTVITVFRDWLLRHYDAVFLLNALLFGLSAILCFVLVQQLPFNALEILWDPAQWQRLLFSYLLLTLPFLFVATAIALTMMRYHQRIPLVYGVDLIGAGIGAILIMLLLQLIPPADILRVVAISGITAGFFALKNLASTRQQLAVFILLVSILAISFAPVNWLSLHMSEYKGLEQTLLVKDMSLEQRLTSPVSQTDVVRSGIVPFRNAPGLSLNSPTQPPEQLAVFRDGDEMTTIDHYSAAEALEYYDYMSSALPYHLLDAPQAVAVLGASTGSQVLQAVYHDAARIDAVEPDPQLSELITNHYADYFGWEKIADRIRIHTISPRGFAASGNGYDLVIIGPSGASTGGAAGVHALSTNYDSTIEALRAYIDLLAPNGMLSITQWTSTPARGNLKLFNTAVTAMKKQGIKQPGEHIAWIRSWNTATLLISKAALTADHIARVREFSKTRSFDIAWLPGINPTEINRYQLLREPVFYLAANDILNNAGNTFTDSYKYDIKPSTDNRPYFNNFFRWDSLNEFLSLPGRAGISMIGVGYPTLLLTLAQATIAAVVLILLPLFFVKDKATDTANGRRNTVIYFLAIGLAFLFIEIAFIHKLTLILSQPLYAVAVTLCAFLVFSGFGSLYIQRYMQQHANAPVSAILRNAVISIGLITVAYVVLLPLLSNALMGLQETIRIITTFLLAAPLAFVMGMPFPIGLTRVQQSNAHLTPWAWGINGCASVLSAILAVLLAMEIGFSGVMLCAVGLYLVAWLTGSH